MKLEQVHTCIDTHQYHVCKNLGLEFFSPDEWFAGEELKKGIKAKLTGDEHDMLVKDRLFAAAVELNPVDTLVFAGRMKPPRPGSLAALARSLSPSVGR